MDGGSRSCPGIVIAKKKSKKFKFKKLLIKGLGTLISGMIFGIGCVIVEHIDNTWWQDGDSSTEQVAVKKYQVSNRDSV